MSLPVAFGRINKYKKLIEKILYEMEEETLKEYWGYDLVWLVLKDIFKRFLNPRISITACIGCVLIVGIVAGRQEFGV